MSGLTKEILQVKGAEVVRRFDSRAMAAKEMGITVNGMAPAINSATRTAAGFHWISPDRLDQYLIDIGAATKKPPTLGEEAYYTVDGIEYKVWPNGFVFRKDGGEYYKSAMSLQELQRRYRQRYDD